MSKPTAIVLAVVLAGIAFCAGVLVARATRPPPPELTLRGPVAPPTLSANPTEVPSFSFVDQHGKRRDTRDWRGKWVLVNFWATWCSPCRHEIPTFIDLQKRYAARGVQFVGVAVDARDAVLTYAREQGLNYPTMTGQEDALDLMRRYGNRDGALPFTVLLDPRGKVAFKRTGALGAGEAASLLERSVSSS